MRARGVFMLVLGFDYAPDDDNAPGRALHLLEEEEEDYKTTCFNCTTGADTRAVQYISCYIRKRTFGHMRE